MKVIPVTLIFAVASLSTGFAAEEKSLTTSAPVSTIAAPKERPVAQTPDGVWPLPIGATVPEITLQTFDGKAFDLGAAIEAKPTVLIFYRGGWCPFCNGQLSQLQSINGNLTRLGYQILAVSPDKPTELAKTLAKEAVSYTLLSDADARLIRAMGLAFRVEDAMIAKYRDNGIDLEKSSGKDHHLLPVPGVFVLDQKGAIQFSYVNPNHKVRLNPELLLTAARLARLDSAPTVPASSFVKK